MLLTRTAPDPGFPGNFPEDLDVEFEHRGILGGAGGGNGGRESAVFWFVLGAAAATAFWWMLGVPRREKIDS